MGFFVAPGLNQISFFCLLFCMIDTCLAFIVCDSSYSILKTINQVYSMSHIWLYNIQVLVFFFCFSNTYAEKEI